MSEPLNVVIIGCGRIAGGYDEQGSDSVNTHAAAYRQHAGFNLLACVEPDDRRREAFQAYWGVERAFVDLDALYASGLRPDVVSICSPTAQHAADLQRVLAERPAAVFSEKPLCDDLGTACRLVADYEAAGVPLMVNYLRRWDASLQQLQAEIATGQWGRIQAAVGFYSKGLLHTGSHLVDLLHAFCGPLEVEHVSRVFFDYDDQDPSIDAVLRSKDGACVHLVAVDSRHYETFELRLMMSAGVVSVENFGFSIRRQPVQPQPGFPEYRVLAPADVQESGLGKAFTAAMDELHALATGRSERAASNGATALMTHETCHVLREQAMRMV